MYPGVMPDYMSWMMIGSYLLWAFVIAVAAYLVIQIARPRQTRSTARSILEERLARGEITEEQFRSLLTTMS